MNHGGLVGERAVAQVDDLGLGREFDGAGQADQGRKQAAQHAKSDVTGDHAAKLHHWPVVNKGTCGRPP